MSTSNDTTLAPRPLADQRRRRLPASAAFGWLGAGWVDTVMWLVAALLAYTVVNRLAQRYHTP